MKRSIKDKFNFDVFLVDKTNTQTPNKLHLGRFPAENDAYAIEAAKKKFSNMFKRLCTNSHSVEVERAYS